MNRSIFIAIVLITSVCTYPHVVFTGGVPEQDVAGQKANGLQLSKQLRRLLSAEMNGLQSGMTGLVTAVPAGQWEGVAETAKKIKTGYIMKKKLSGTEMENFLHSLPAGYREIDNEFQETISRLMKAAEERDSGRVNSYFCKLNQTCVKCHSVYAVNRFPGFK